MNERGFIHHENLDEFISWAHAAGWSPEPKQGRHEAIRLRRSGEVALYYNNKRHTGAFTTHGNGVRLVKQ